MALRVHHPNCPLCLQKNPDYISNILVHTVIDMTNNRIVMIFGDMNEAIKYIQDHPLESWALGDSGYVENNKNNSMS